MAGFFAGILQITLSAIVTTSVLIPVFKNTNTSTWTTAEVSLWGLTTLAIIAGMVNGILNLFGMGV